jgi:GDPmannose 4,6-dehydratase
LPAALIIGHKGQDGTYLYRGLSEKGYTVTGIDRASPGTADFKDAPDIGSKSAMCSLLARTRPNEIYYLAAYHHSSQQQRVDHHLLISRSLKVNTLGLNNVLHAVAEESPETKVFYAGSSRIFGDPSTPVQNEDTPFRPRCAYGISKAAGAQICGYYRDTRGVFAATGILYNHESPLRPLHFISRKIVAAAVGIARGRMDKLVLGGLDDLVDWGYAPDYTEAMWRMLQLEKPVDCLIGTGILHSVRDFVDLAFQAVHLDWRDYVTVNATLLSHPSSKTALCADSSRLRSLTGWKPTLSFQQMIQTMIAAEKEVQKTA